MNRDIDRELFEQIRTQDSEKAFRALFDRHYERMFRVALYFVQDEDLAKEVALDVLARIWEKRKTMIVPDDWRHYSFVMVKNAAMNALKSMQMNDSRVSLDASAEVITDNATRPDELLEQTELFETYERLLTELPERCREVYTRVKEDGRSYAEVAEEMGISVKTVDAQLQKALAYLRQHLACYLDRKSGRRFAMLFL